MDRKEFVSRIGTFFVVIGGGLLFLFTFSEVASQTNFGYFCWAAILITIGFLLRAQHKPPPPPSSGRFSLLKKLKPKPKEEKKDEKK